MKMEPCRSSLAAVLASVGAESIGDPEQRVVRAVAELLNVPAALLRLTERGWSFVAEAGAPGQRKLTPPWREQTPIDMRHDIARDSRWTGVVFGTGDAPSWILLLPGGHEDWESTRFISDVAPRLAGMLEGRS